MRRQSPKNNTDPQTYQTSAGTSSSKGAYTVTAILKAEHDAIKRMLAVASSICELLENGDDIDPKHLHQIVDFIRTFADKYHHGKEEKLLLEAMIEDGAPNVGDIVHTLRKEHDMGREFVRSMSDAADLYPRDREQSARKFARNARRYVVLLNQHIENEDNIVFPMADRHLPEEKRREIVEGFERFDRDFVGDDELNKYLALLDGLCTVYAKLPG